MDTRIRSFIFLIMFILLLITGCNSTANISEFEDVIKVKNIVDMNHSIQLFLDPYQPTHLRDGEKLYFQILNKSNKEIRFPGDANIQIFIHDNAIGGWQEVGNNIEYQGRGDLIVPTTKEGLHDMFIMAQPVLKFDGEPEKTIRVVVTGMVVQDGVDSDKAVSAFLDLTIQQ